MQLPIRSTKEGITFLFCYPKVNFVSFLSSFKIFGFIFMAISENLCVAQVEGYLVTLEK